MDTDPKDAKLAKVQAQLAKILSLVKEECKVRKETEVQLAKKEAQLETSMKTTNNSPQAPAVPVKGPKIHLRTV
ncbi:uncharacterized protein PGTG_21844 [Puccinia graminis f. sp. tritici CRL 75-36-700-3]|uniref:Uncharacterized protein n=1 Tax=Puccinia graminis f. sp. tritici (strain CRL 75-36-700-3 / race SCCL) TaxID=418459 RepID=H6QSK1_PUCGT|nr:uncharacterized protein PGTG_21844 [Puccinia graminis f. sp. tritici CRL 75-36-700-3]EHS63752.1 hypothetical protein PGTG_21844 [Puccinia graminis f. sp. tritici CRL 75-36-700-3]